MRSILEGILLETMFELPDLDGVAEIAIDRTTVEGSRKPRYIYAEKHRDLRLGA